MTGEPTFPPKQNKLPADPTIRYSYRIGEALLKRLQAAADERVLSVNWIVNHAVEEYLDRLDAAVGEETT